MQRELLLLLTISALAKALPQNEVNNGINNDTMVETTAPRFKHPSNRMFDMNYIMKPAGSSIRMKCDAKGNPMPNITWSKNNGPIERSKKPMYGKWSLVLDELTRTDEGNYTCLVCNELACISHTVNLTVQERIFLIPVITKGPLNQTVAVGETVTFSCEFLTDLHPYVTWQFFRTYEALQYRNSTNGGAIMTSAKPDHKTKTLTIANVTQEQRWALID